MNNIENNKSISELSSAQYIADNNIFLISQKQDNDQYVSKSITYADLRNIISSNLPLSDYDQFITKDQIVSYLDIDNGIEISEKQRILSYNGIVDLNKKITAKLRALCNKIEQLTLSVNSNALSILNNTTLINNNATNISNNKKFINYLSSLILPNTTSENQLINIEWANNEILKSIDNYRGTFDTIDDIPDDVNLYEKDLNGNTIPHKYDYIIIKNAPAKLDAGRWVYIYTENNWNDKKIKGWQPLYQLLEQMAKLNTITCEPLTKQGEQIAVITIDDNLYSIYNGLDQTFPKYSSIETVQEFEPAYYSREDVGKYITGTTGNSDATKNIDVNFIFLADAAGGHYATKTDSDNILTSTFKTTKSGWYKLEIVNNLLTRTNMYVSNYAFLSMLYPIYFIKINDVIIHEFVNSTNGFGATNGFGVNQGGVVARGGPLITTQLFYCPANTDITYGINDKILDKLKLYFETDAPWRPEYLNDIAAENKDKFPFCGKFKYTLSIIN